MTEPNAFAGAVLDRAGEHRTDEAWVAEQREHPRARAVQAGDGGILVADGRLALVALREAADPEPLLLGLDADGPVFAAQADGAPGLLSLREAAATLPQAEGGLAAYAAALLGWHRRHRFCANCGNPTAIREAGHVRHCPACGTDHHPRTDPVVIMLVVRGDDVLLGRQAAWPPGRYSALAGFVEPGESLEEAVAREVYEESGVEDRPAALHLLAAVALPGVADARVHRAVGVGRARGARPGARGHALVRARRGGGGRRGRRGAQAPAPAGDRPAPDRALADRERLTPPLHGLNLHGAVTLEGWIFMVGLRVFDVGALVVWLVWFFRLRDDEDDDGDDFRGGSEDAPDPGPTGAAAG